MTTQFKVNSFKFNIYGLQISFTLNNNPTVLTFDPAATCDLLKNAGVIEDFDLDKNGEPVILFTDNNKPHGYGFEYWFQFVKSYFFSNRHAEIMIEYLLEVIELKAIYSKIDHISSFKIAA